MRAWVPKRRLQVVRLLLFASRSIGFFAQIKLTILLIVVGVDELAILNLLQFVVKHKLVEEEVRNVRSWQRLMLFPEARVLGNRPIRRVLCLVAPMAAHR